MPEPTYGSLLPERHAGLRGESEEGHSLPDLKQIWANTSDQKIPKSCNRIPGLKDLYRITSK